jgi:hypothetical protein
VAQTSVCASPPAIRISSELRAFLRALLGEASAGKVSTLLLYFLYFLYFLCLLYILFLSSRSIWTLHASPRSSPQQGDTRRSQPGNRDHHERFPAFTRVSWALLF